MRRVRKRLSRPGHFEAKRFGGKVVSGPQRGIAAAGIVGDLLAIGCGENGIENRAERLMAKLENRVNGDRVGLGRAGHGKQQEESKSAHENLVWTTDFAYAQTRTRGSRALDPVYPR